MSVIKVIKIGLPVATATSAAIATTSLVSFRKKDKLSKEEDLDQGINDLNIPDEKYEDKELFYSKNGSGKNQAILDKSLADKLSQLLKEKGDLSASEGSAPDLSKLNLDQIVQDALPSHGQGQEHNDSKDQKETDPLGTKNDKPERTTDQSNLSDDDGSKSAKDEGPSLQISKVLEAQDAEVKENLDGDSETNSLINVDEGQSSKDTQDQENSNLQELGDSLKEGSPEDVLKTSSSQALPQSQDDNPIQNPEDGGMKGVGDSHNKKGPEGFEDEGTSVEGKDVHSAGSNPNGTDSGGNKATFTEEDMKKWSELGDQLSSVVVELASLIDN